MHTTVDTQFMIHPIDPFVLGSVRATGRDRSGIPAVARKAEGGEKLRCCLQNADNGESLLLFGYEPPLPPSPYRETGAVFIHADACAGPADTAYPEAWRGRPQVLRAYDKNGWIHDARMHDGNDPETVIAEMLADPAVVQLHSRNVAYGCWMFTVTR